MRNSVFQVLRLKLPGGNGLWWCLLLAACASQPEKIAVTPPPAPPTATTAPQPANPRLAGSGSYQATSVSGDYAHYPALDGFINDMSQKYGFRREYLHGLFSQARRKQWTLDYLHNADQGAKSGHPAKGGWSRYRSQFLDARHIDGGVAFWHRHDQALQRASQRYGVPPEYILGILGVETGYGANVGNHRVLDALTTLGFDYPRRGEYFRGELEHFLVMTASEGIDPGKPLGSFAGAMGLGQFMPGSFLEWAVDFNGDGRRDLWNPEDAIGSVGNYFASHGWQSGGQVVSTTRGHPANLESGIESQYSLETLRQAGLQPAGTCRCDQPLRLLLLRHQSHDEYLLGHANFYVITRYNHSTHYAMAVHELAQAIKQAYKG